MLKINNLANSIKNIISRKFEDLIIQLQNSKFIEELDLFLNRIYGFSVATISLSSFPFISALLYSRKKFYFGGVIIHTWERLKFHRQYEKMPLNVEEVVEFFYMTNNALYNLEEGTFVECQKHNLKIFVKMIFVYIKLLPQIIKLYRTNKLVYVNFVLNNKPINFDKFVSEIKIFNGE